MGLGSSGECTSDLLSTECIVFTLILLRLFVFELADEFGERDIVGGDIELFTAEGTPFIRGRRRPWTTCFRRTLSYAEVLRDGAMG
jgi:hypothetical protein